MVKVTEDDEGYIAGIEEFLSDDSDDDENTQGFLDMLNKKERLFTLAKTFDNVIIVGGLPKVPENKKAALERAILKKVKKSVEYSASSLVVEMPLDEKTQETTGCAVMKFENSSEARHAVTELNHTQLDKRHVMTACLLDHFDKIVSRDETTPGVAANVGFNRKGLRWWLNKQEALRGYEQFAVRFAVSAKDDDRKDEDDKKQETEIYWHDPVGREPILIDNGQQSRLTGNRVWTNKRISWSPQGSYFVTFHRLGVVLWGCEGFNELARFAQKDVGVVTFSPNEDYIVTYDSSSHSMQNDKAIQVWRVITQELISAFRTPASSPSGLPEWPLVAWSHDSKYLASGIDNDPSTICIYKTPDLSKVLDMSFELPNPLKPKDAAAKGQEQGPVSLKFEWSPAANILSVFIPEKPESPSRVSLFEIPSKTELASKNLYNVKEASMHWHSKGLYFALLTTLVRKTGKKGKQDFTQMEIFRIEEKNIPIDTIQIESLKVRQFHWEPSGNRLAVLVQDEATHGQSIRFYSVSHTGTKRDTQLCCTFPVVKEIDYLSWSPQGSNFIAAGLGNDGSLIFASLTDQNKVDVYKEDEHQQVNYIAWDSSGRYICTAVCLPMGGAAAYQTVSETGYRIWTFQGRLHKNMRSEDPRFAFNFYIFQWRPRPPSLLPPAKEREVYRRLKHYAKKYDEIDEKLKQEKKESFQKGRKVLADSFAEVVEKTKEWQKAHPMYKEWVIARERLEASFEYEEQEEIVEEEIGVRSEVV